MKKIINITNNENDLVASFEIDWEDKTVNIITHEDYKVIDGEVFATVKN